MCLNPLAKAGIATIPWPKGFRLAEGMRHIVPKQKLSALLVLGWAFLVVGLTPAGCSKKEPFVPPDLLYLFKTYTVGKNPTSISTADFNRDGITDLITTNIGNNTLSILYGVGDGTFTDHVRIAACREPRALALNHYNRDEFVDLAVACSGSDEVRIFFGHESGMFGVGPSYTMHRTPVSVTSGDINGDEQLDLLVALRNDKIQILLSRGDGSFKKGPQYEYGDTPTSIAASDLNRDGNLDLAVTNGGPMSSAVSVWLGKGDGTFRLPRDYRTGKRPLKVAFADFNNDATTDLLVVNGERDTFTIFLGNGDGTFQEGKDDGANAGPVYGLARDFNGDRFADVAIVNIQSGDLSILYGRGDGTFRHPPRNYRTKGGGGPFAIATLQLSSEAVGEPGLVVANNGGGSVSIFLHKGLRGRRTAAVPEQS